MDIDEEAFRRGEVRSRLYGYLTVPGDRRHMQGQKAGTPKSEKAVQEAIAHDILERLSRDALALVGPGSTTRELKRLLGREGTLLGVDAFKAGVPAGEDCNEGRLLELIALEPGGDVRIVVTPIGGQGFLFGRGNQQFSPEVLRRAGREGIWVASTPGSGTTSPSAASGQHTAPDCSRRHGAAATGKGPSRPRRPSGPASLHLHRSARRCASRAPPTSSAP